MGKKRVLITGASGFIGARIAEKLSQLSDFEVICAGRSKSKKGWLIGNLSDKSFAVDASKNCDALIHAAGKAGAWGPYAEYFDANVKLTQTLLEAAQMNGVKRFINISSPSIYFEFHDQFNLKETDLPESFSNHYARSKFEAEELVRKAHGQGLETLSFRPRFVVGRGDRTVVPRMIRLQKKGLLFQAGDGKNVVDITSVSNLVDAVLLALKAPSSAMGETYNISNGKPIPFWSLVDLIMKEVGLSGRRMRIPKTLLMTTAKINETLWRLAGRESEPGLLPISVAVLSQSMTLNIDKAQEKLGYSANQSTEEAVHEFGAWWLGQSSLQVAQ